jgi:D-alanyl-lipoteichoic acid acyltransferase DltB (MBOAT superfamily)
MVIADRLAIFVNEVYNSPQSYQGFPLIWATYFFAIQIYCDFSGYSDIAIGASRIMGIELMQNFRTPYFSKSIQEFWSRWHISLSSWFKSYLYIPLGGNRVVTWRRYYNLIIVFAVSGLWHGANWTFILWGLLHGIYIIGGIILFKFAQLYFKKVLAIGKNRLVQVFSVIITFHLVLITWVLFRANNIHDALYIFKNFTAISISSMIGVPTISLKFFIISLVLIPLLFVSEKYQTFTKIDSIRVVNYMKVFFLFSLIYILGIFEVQQFIYFQF